LKAEVEFLMKEINSLRGIIHSSSSIFKITRKNLFENQALRNELKYNREKYIMEEKVQNSFDRQFYNERSKMLAEQDTFDNSQYR
jgi:predicted nucleotide-binding protein (sugar kinase/HSP70/actin superfamily)